VREDCEKRSKFKIKCEVLKYIMSSVFIINIISIVVVVIVVVVVVITFCAVV